MHSLPAFLKYFVNLKRKQTILPEVAALYFAVMFDDLLLEDATGNG